MASNFMQPHGNGPLIPAIFSAQSFSVTHFSTVFPRTAHIFATLVYARLSLPRSMTQPYYIRTKPPIKTKFVHIPLNFIRKLSGCRTLSRALSLLPIAASTHVYTHTNTPTPPPPPHTYTPPPHPHTPPHPPPPTCMLYRPASCRDCEELLSSS